MYVYQRARLDSTNDDPLRTYPMRPDWHGNANDVTSWHSWRIVHQNPHLEVVPISDLRLHVESSAQGGMVRSAVLCLSDQVVADRLIPNRPPIYRAYCVPEDVLAMLVCAAAWTSSGNKGMPTCPGRRNGTVIAARSSPAAHASLGEIDDIHSLMNIR